MTALNNLLSDPLIERYLRENPLVYVDVGAAVGVEEPWLTLLASHNVTRVVAFEPHPENFRGIHRLPNGVYHQLAIGVEAGKADFFLDSTCSSLMDRSSEAGRPLEAMQVDVETLARLREAGTIPSLDIVKTDAELTDFETIASCGSFLDDEVLCVQCEFFFHAEGRERPFREFDSLLQSKGLMLFGLSLQQGGQGELDGGNCLYLRSIFNVLHGPGSDNDKRFRALKLFVIALGIHHLDTAYIIARAVEQYGLFDAPDAKQLKKLALTNVYLPDAGSFAAWRVRAATLVGNAAVLIGGGFSRGVSTPKPNRLENYRRLIRPMGTDARREKVEALYETFYSNEARRFQPRTK